MQQSVSEKREPDRQRQSTLGNRPVHKLSFPSCPPAIRQVIDVDVHASASALHSTRKVVSAVASCAPVAPGRITLCTGEGDQIPGMPYTHCLVLCLTEMHAV